MLCPTRDSEEYKAYKKAQKKHPGVDVTQVVADAGIIGGSEAEALAKAKEAKEAEELQKLQDEEDKANSTK